MRDGEVSEVTPHEGEKMRFWGKLTPHEGGRTKATQDSSSSRIMDVLS
jgi:hypothetical protein